MVNGTLVIVKAKESKWMTKKIYQCLTSKQMKWQRVHSFEIVQVEFMSKSAPIPKPLLFRASRMMVDTIPRNHFRTGRGLRPKLQRFPNPIEMKPIDNKFDLGYKLTKANYESVRKDRREFRLAKLQECKPNPPKMSITHIKVNFPRLACVINFKESMEETLAKLSIYSLEGEKQKEV